MANILNTNINKANRKVCDVHFLELVSKKPVWFFDRANVTTQDITADSVYAKGDGARRIPFRNPYEGSFKIEAQIVPFKLYSLIYGGQITSDATYPKREIVKGGAGSLTINPTAEETVVDGFVFVYEKGDFGGTPVEGTFDTKTFTGESISASKEYEVSYLVKRTGKVNHLSINDDVQPDAFYVAMKTFDRDEDNNDTMFQMVFYKAVANGTTSLSQSSEGDPATFTATFDLFVDKDGNFVDFNEVDDTVA